MDIKSVKDIDVAGKLVFLRNDFNVPFDKDLNITDDTRIKAALPTLKYLIKEGAKVVCASHLGRPKGKVVPELSLRPIAERLSQLLGVEVLFNGGLLGDLVEAVKKNLEGGQIYLLENLRFDPREKKNDKAFALELAKDIDVYVNDAFGACHRGHASIVEIADNIGVGAIGLLMKKEVEYLSMALKNPPKNFVAIIGGAKVSDKIPLIKQLLPLASTILIGGAMAYSFLKAKGENVGNSLIEDEHVELCRELLEKSGLKNAKIVLPVDHIAACKMEPNITVRMVGEGEGIPEFMMGLDIGLETVALYSEVIKDAELIFWNGPMGVFEVQSFSGGTIEIAKAVAASSATSIIGGGDSVAAINQTGVRERISHISTGGGASLEFLSGHQLPGISALDKE